MNRFKACFGSRTVGASALVGAVLASALIGLQDSGAAVATAVTSGFTATSSNILAELGLGVAIVVAVMSLGIGIRMLVKWARVAIKAS